MNNDTTQITFLSDKDIAILKYCLGYTSEMWAASITGIILNIDFRDANDNAIRLALKQNGEPNE